MIHLQALRAEVRAWLGEKRFPGDLVTAWGPMMDISPELEAWTVDFRRKLGAKGWLAPSWPKYFGGGGLPPQAGGGHNGGGESPEAASSESQHDLSGTPTRLGY